MPAKNQNFEVYQGDSLNINITVSSSKAVDLTGSTVKWALKYSANGKDILSKDTTNDVTITASNKFTVKLKNTDTQNLSGNFIHISQVTDVGGNVSTVTTGKATIRPSSI